MTNVQSWNPEGYAKNARFVADLGQPVLDLLAARPGERILDLGCGDGALTRKLMDLGCRVVGVDASAPQVEAARAQGVDARVMAGEDLAFGPEFDAVFSNAALHWMPDAERVLAGVHTALRPGGRFVAECGGYGCVDIFRRALIASLRARGHDGEAADPWYFPTVEDYSAKLVTAGFEISYVALIPRPTPLPGDILGWLETFAPPFTRVLRPAERSAYQADVRAQLRPRLCDSEGKWTADYVRLRFSATKPLGAPLQRDGVS
jgi:trans-aconitate methyltransferase